MKMSQEKSKSGKKKTSGILWTALILGLLMPFGLYIALRNELYCLALACFVFLAAGYALTAWKG